jgi:ADP-L-glycero-D-manno-heptose 6-epimerase
MTQKKTATGARFIVTGAAGFIGGNLVLALNERGYDDILAVDCLDAGAKKRNLRDLRFSRFLDKGEFRERILASRQETVTAVFHLGACSSTTETDEPYLMDNNYLYTRDLCEWCLNNDVRFIYASSAATYGDGSLGYSDRDAVTRRLRPLNLYAKSKQRFDLWALEHRALDRVAGIKYFNVYGPREDHKGDMRSVVSKAYDQIRESGALRLFRSHRPDCRDGHQTRDFVYVKDAVDVTLFFLDHPDVCGLFNCGTGKARTWVDLAHAVFRAMKRAPRIRFVNMPAEIRSKYQYHTEADLAKLRRAGCKKRFASLETGVEDYVAGCLSFLRP